MTDFDRAVAAWIRATAGAKKLGQDALAQRVGINVNTFRRYWRGERSISLGDFRLILDALEVLDGDAMQDINRIFESGNYAD